MKSGMSPVLVIIAILTSPVARADAYAVDVAKFGAKCNASPTNPKVRSDDSSLASDDDAAAIQAAIDSLPRGGVVVLPPRICAVSKAVILKPYVTLRGQGRSTSRIHLKISTASTPENPVVALDLGKAVHASVKDLAVWVSGAQIAINVASASEVTISNVSASSSAPQLGTGVFIHKKYLEAEGSYSVKVRDSNFEGLTYGAQVGSGRDAELSEFPPEIRESETRNWEAQGKPTPRPWKPFTSANATAFENCKFSSNITGMFMENAVNISVTSSRFEANSYGITTWTDAMSLVERAFIQASYFESNKNGSIIFTPKVSMSTLAYNFFGSNGTANGGHPLLSGSMTLFLGAPGEYKIQP